MARSSWSCAKAPVPSPINGIPCPFDSAVHAPALAVRGAGGRSARWMLPGAAPGAVPSQTTSTAWARLLLAVQLSPEAPPPQSVSAVGEGSLTSHCTLVSLLGSSVPCSTDQLKLLAPVAGLVERRRMSHTGRWRWPAAAETTCSTGQPWIDHPVST